MAERRYEIRCDVCKKWHPMRGRYDSMYPPEGWLTVSYQPGHLNVEIPEIDVCSWSCLESGTVYAWIMDQSRKNREEDRG